MSALPAVTYAVRPPRFNLSDCVLVGCGSQVIGRCGCVCKTWGYRRQPGAASVGRSYVGAVAPCLGLLDGHPNLA